ncbi:MAG: MBL fold metallo-hydrolase [Thermoguttaceae bacterium]|nr:MBL fold metallo-hydrolase [Thermoguttaceae bacterium]
MVNSQDESLYNEDYIEQPGYRTVPYEHITIEGHSRAAIQTFWRIPEYKLGFDMGAMPWEYAGVPRWFFSHMHMDHCLALPAYLARRRMAKMPPPDVYLPEEKVSEARQLAGVFARLDQGKLPCNFIGLRDGDTVELSRELVVTASKTMHPVPSLGYIVWERKKKLKPEYASLSNDAIRNLSLSGTEVSRELRHPKVAYLGDSSVEGLDYNPDFYRADVLIVEMTFASPGHRRDSLRRHGHIHLDDIVARRDKFENKLIIASHFSVRYSDYQIERFVRRQIPDMLDGRLILWF